MSKKVDIRELIREEYKKCAVNPAYFMRKYCYIQHMIRGRMLFDLYDYQEEATTRLQNESRVVVLKARQLGFSTLVACYALWMTTFHRDKNILVIATKQETAKNLITKARFAYENLPVWLRSPVTENNKLNLRFKNGSQIKAVSSSSDAARSESVSLLIVDECAFIDGAEEIWIAAQATLATGGHAILISTPNGMGNFFHRVWQGTENKQNDFWPIKLTWRVHPDRDEAWYTKEFSVYGERGFRQEYEAEFLGSGNSVFDADIIQWYKDNNQIEPMEKSGFDGNLWIWEPPNYSKAYIVTADVSRGDGSDYSGFHVIDVDEMTQVAEYKGKIETDDFGHMLVEIATKYNDAFLVVENSNNGWSTVQTIVNRQYKNIFYMSDDPRVIEENKHVTNKWRTIDKKKVPGFTTSPKSRPLIISKLDEYLRHKDILIRSSRSINELFTFIWHNGKAEAQEGYNDDLVMSLAIGLWVRDTSLKVFKNNVDIQRAILSAISKSGDESKPLYRPDGLNYDPFKMNVGTSVSPYDQTGEEDFRWLLG